MCVYVGSNLIIYEFERWVIGVYSPHVISLYDFAYYVVGLEPAVAVHLTIWYIVLVCHQNDVCEASIGSVYVGGYCGLSKANSVSSVFL